MRLFRSSKAREAASYPPNQPHPYVPGKDAGVMALASGGVSGSSRMGLPASSLAIANRARRIQGCAVPGCGRQPDDAIHAPED